MRTAAFIVLFTIIAAALSACDDAGRAPEDTDRVASEVALSDALGGEPDPGFARARGPRTFRFPYEHGPHFQYRNEWWYVTTNLTDAAGRRYGVQFTLFRIGLEPGRERARPSHWATHQIWMAHLALTDVAGERFRAAERFARGGEMRLAGGRRDPVRVWLEDWRLERQTASAHGPDGIWHLTAGTDAFHIELELVPRKRPVLQGEHGLSQKSAEPGNASYYYSITRLAAQGTLTIGGTPRAVRGSAWLDREWSTSALGPEQAGWNWFALQLEDGTDIMLYRLRRKDGTPSPFSAGTVVGPEGRVRGLEAADFEIVVLDRWRSPQGGRYPSRWRIRIDGLGEPLLVTPVLADQELDLTVRYWEGAVNVHREGARIGVGYVELTGYTGYTGERPRTTRE